MLDILVKKDVKYLVFSSSAAVYGNVCTCPISEEASLCPASPYGRTKHIIEQALADYRSAYGLHSISLRYFNAAGADTNACLGERHDPETHLIPLVLQVASGRRDAIRIFGRGYDTEDGTCIRDYVHVTDLCDAHLLALKALRNGQPVRPAYNLGNGEGHSVSEVIRTAGEVTGRSIKTIDAPMRPGDPAMLVADTSMARRDLGWRPRRCSLAAIIEDAWRWELAKGMFW